MHLKEREMLPTLRNGMNRSHARACRRLEQHRRVRDISRASSHETMLCLGIRRNHIVHRPVPAQTILVHVGHIWEGTSC